METAVTVALFLIALFVFGGLLANVVDNRHAARKLKAREARLRELEEQAANETEEEPADETAA